MYSSKLELPEWNEMIRIHGGHMTTVEAEWSYHKHQHRSFELLHCLEGWAVEWINGRAVHLSAGDWLFLSSGVMHSTITGPEAPFTYFTIHFDTDNLQLREQWSECDYLKFSNQEGVLQSLLNQVQSLVERSDPKEPKTADKLRIHAYLLQMVAVLLDQLNDMLHEPRQHNISPTEVNLAHSIEAQLQAAVFTSDTVEQIAGRLFISRNQCTSVFQKVYGLPPHRYVSLLKLKMAKELILRSDMPLEEIGERLGFSCASSFSRQFRRWTGYAPARLRSNRRKQTEAGVSSPNRE